MFFPFSALLFVRSLAMVRHKNRYILVRVVWEASKDDAVATRTQFPATGKPVMDALVASLSTRYGAFGRGVLRKSYALKLWSPESGYGVVRAARDWADVAKDAVRGVTLVDGTAAALRIEYIGGSIYSCTKHATLSAREELLRLSQNLSA